MGTVMRERRAWAAAVVRCGLWACSNPILLRFRMCKTSKAWAAKRTVRSVEWHCIRAWRVARRGVAATLHTKQHSAVQVCTTQADHRCTAVQLGTALYSL